MDDNKKRYFRINEITEWGVDMHMVQSVAAHTSDSYEALLWEAKDMVKKAMESRAGVHLPLVCEAKDKSDAIAQYAETHYPLEFAIPTDGEVEEVHKFEVSVQVDCRVDVEVYGKDFDDARERSHYANFDLSKCDVIETHPVNATDTATGEFRELC